MLHKSVEISTQPPPSAKIYTFRLSETHLGEFCDARMFSFQNRSVGLICCFLIKTSCVVWIIPLTFLFFPPFLSFLSVHFCSERKFLQHFQLKAEAKVKETDFQPRMFNSCYLWLSLVRCSVNSLALC